MVAIFSLLTTPLPLVDRSVIFLAMKIHPNTAGSMISLLIIALLAGAHGQTTNGVDADGYWDTSIGVPGSDGPIRAMVVTPSTVVVGGSFGRIGGINANFIAQWDGHNWSGLGSGVTGGFGPQVLALAAQGGNIYAAGVFSLAGGVPAGNIAKWDGDKWSALGTGIPTVVKALAVSGTDLYAGAEFSSAGGVAAANIARWDGTNWHAVGSGLPGYTVNCLAASRDALYVGGYFTNWMDGVEIKYLAKWDGLQWSPLGSRLYADPYSVLLHSAVQEHEILI
ncbi:MAG: hypothetical protein M1608_08800 [Candidatus Omnitrophica bacterium]|nr:hypothetical protein [Candidatus Omnitrophota bacterium]